MRANLRGGQQTTGTGFGRARLLSKHSIAATDRLPVLPSIGPRNDQTPSQPLWHLKVVYSTGCRVSSVGKGRKTDPALRISSSTPSINPLPRADRNQRHFLCHPSVGASIGCMAVSIRFGVIGQAARHLVCQKAG